MELKHIKNQKVIRFLLLDFYRKKESFIKKLK